MIMRNTFGEDVLAWMQTHPRAEGYELVELIECFGLARERMRDQLRRLVEAGYLAQSAPVRGVADANPIYSLIRQAVDAEPRP